MSAYENVKERLAVSEGVALAVQAGNAVAVDGLTLDEYVWVLDELERLVAMVPGTRAASRLTEELDRLQDEWDARCWQRAAKEATG